MAGQATRATLHKLPRDSPLGPLGREGCKDAYAISPLISPFDHLTWYEIMSCIWRKNCFFSLSIIASCIIAGNASVTITSVGGKNPDYCSNSNTSCVQNSLDGNAILVPVEGGFGLSTTYPFDYWIPIAGFALFKKSYLHYKLQKHCLMPSNLQQARVWTPLPTLGLVPHTAAPSPKP